MTPLGAPDCRIENGHYLLKMKGLNDLINSRNFIFYVILIEYLQSLLVHSTTNPPPKQIVDLLVEMIAKAGVAQYANQGKSQIFPVLS